MAIVAPGINLFRRVTALQGAKTYRSYLSWQPSSSPHREPVRFSSGCEPLFEMRNRSRYMVISDNIHVYIQCITKIIHKRGGIAQSSRRGRMDYLLSSVSTCCRSLMIASAGLDLGASFFFPNRFCIHVTVHIMSIRGCLQHISTDSARKERIT